ncbi:MAG TPA: PIN domain-containing protein [Fimbriimonas sp.]
MKVLLDASVLVAGLWQDHPEHRSAVRVLASCRDGKETGCISQHSVAEVYSQLSSLRTAPRFHPSSIRSVVGEVLWHLEIVPLDEADYIQALDEAANLEVRGDAFSRLLNLRAAHKAGSRCVVSLDLESYPATSLDLARP